jgi:hypothetical protein
MTPAPIIAQLESILKDFASLQAKSSHDDLSDTPKHERQALITRSVAAVHRIAGPNSAYAAELARIFQSLAQIHMHMTSVIGVVKGLLADVNGGYLQSLVDLVHAETFADFAEMAQHLADAGYKDAAAVVVGSALESHLRALCDKFGIATDIAKPDGSVVAKKADAMNSELTAKSVYGKLDQKSVTAWLDLRNKAAHGKYDEYQKDQVLLMISGIRDFLSRMSGP